jgi:adenylate kinase
MSGEARRCPHALVFLGPPGAGKGTQARLITRSLGIPHISTGDLLRENVEKGTPLGRTAKAFMERGELVSDQVVNGMVQERLGQPDCCEGFLLDGYPRTLEQAEVLDRLLESMNCGASLVVNLAVDYNVIVNRLGGRRICPVCQRTYNLVSQPPFKDNVCDDDGAVLQQRPDDREEAIRERLGAYEARTAPLIEYYKGRGSLYEIDGDRSPDQVADELMRVVRQQVIRK